MMSMLKIEQRGFAWQAVFQKHKKHCKPSLFFENFPPIHSYE